MASALLTAPSPSAPARPGAPARLPAKPAQAAAMTSGMHGTQAHYRPPRPQVGAAAQPASSVGRRRAGVGTTTTADTYPVPETEKERSPIDFPQV